MRTEEGEKQRERIEKHMMGTEIKRKSDWNEGTMEDWNGLRRDIYKEEVHMNKKMRESEK